MLAKSTVLPKRNFETLQDFKEYFEQYKTLILDATERCIYKIKLFRKTFYSGGKHTL